MLAVATVLGSCAPLGVTGDGTSVSSGRSNGGLLLDGARMPESGPGFVTHRTWERRGLRYGTDELVVMLTEVSSRLARYQQRCRKRRCPVMRLGIGDLSHDGGGLAAPFHRSHQTGRDVDLLLFMLDSRGRPYESSAMTPLGDDGRALDGSGRRLDVRRTWRLVRELALAPEARVQYGFLYEPLTQLLLDHGRAIGEREAVLDQVRIMLGQPQAIAPHNDHLHIRIYCARHDVDSGSCVDVGSLARLDKRGDELRLWSRVNTQLLSRLPVAGSSLVAWGLRAGK